MKTIFRIIILSFLLTCTTLLSAQQVSTLYFLESAPMRHTINPAFQPASNFYLTFPFIGYTSISAGLNSWTLSDFLFKGPDGNTITPWHPDAVGWEKSRPKWFAMDADMSVNIFSFGFRVKKGYFHLNISERLTIGSQVSSSIFLLNKIDTEKANTYSLSTNAIAYTDVAFGYSHVLNDKWTVGGKLKVLLGQANFRANISELKFTSNVDELSLSAKGEIYAAAPIHWEQVSTDMQDLGSLNMDGLLFRDDLSTKENIMNLIKPAGAGVALDLGMTYKPIKNLQITASVTDFGVMSWNRHGSASASLSSTFTGVDFDFSDGGTGDFVGTLTDSLGGVIDGLSDGLSLSDVATTDLPPSWGMLSAKLNVGVDANFWDNRVGVGIYSRTQFHNSRVSEELTFGVALRPANWFQLAASYSLINGRGGNIGAALNFAPYDGIMFTMAADYIPLSYAKLATSIAEVPVPYKTPGFNLSFGVAIVAGTNGTKEERMRAKDEDLDGVTNRYDLCPNTPKDVKVDENGCPFDTDGDGVADYLDQCPDTPGQAIGMVDSLGCPLDADLDSVPDYLDLCPNTPAQAIDMVDSLGCLLDADADSVPDYLDLCPDTPLDLYGAVDSVGCPLDADGDGVLDHQDMCPDTPQEAYNYITLDGCPLDIDQDGVYDYLDTCPDTTPEARQHVDSVGCPLDSDGDGIYDYEDFCPNAPGSPETKGCPEINSEVRNVLNQAMAAIRFENGKATIKSTSYEMLDVLADLFIDNPEYKVEVQGHTDDLGQHDFNLDLSNRRAHSVRTYLVNKGVPASQLTARGYGSDMPITDNNTKEGRELNSRVEFNISVEEIINDTIGF